MTSIYNQPAPPQQVKSWLGVFPPMIRHHISMLRGIYVPHLPSEMQERMSDHQEMIELIDALHGLLPYPSASKWDFRKWIDMGFSEGLITRTEHDALREFGIDSLGF